jgi:hypothetical protein
MLAITLGFAEAGRTAPPVFLYAGTDASQAEALFLAPPDGIIRTELYKNPAVTRRHFFDAPVAVAPPADDAPAKAKKA